MNNLNKEKIRSNYFLILFQIIIVLTFIFSPIISSQSQFSGSVETDKYDFEYELINLNIPFKYIYSLTIIKENKKEIDDNVSIQDTIKLILYLKGYKPTTGNSIWGKFLRKGQKKNSPPYQILIKGTNGFFKTQDVLANYEYRNSTTVELFISPIITKKEKREKMINTFNSKYAVEDALELFIKASFE